MEELLKEKRDELKTKNKFPSLRAGDQVLVHLRVKEGDKERTQAFKGTIIKVQGKNLSRSFTIRKISNGVGVEKTIPFLNPNLDKIEVLSRSKVRQSRVYYLRKLKGRAARLQSLDK